MSKQKLHNFIRVRFTTPEAAQKAFESTRDHYVYRAAHSQDLSYCKDGVVFIYTKRLLASKPTVEAFLRSFDGAVDKDMEGAYI